jgi:hypothetical protein
MLPDHFEIECFSIKSPTENQFTDTAATEPGNPD